MISKLKEIGEALNIFHDGKLVLITHDANFWKFEIQIPYLAKILDVSYQKFYLRVETLDAPYYYPWKKDSSKLLNIDILSMFIPKALSADLNTFNQIEWQVEMTNQIAPVYEGGVIVTMPKSLNVYDEEFNRMSFESLKELRKKYLQSVTPR